MIHPLNRAKAKVAVLFLCASLSANTVFAQEAASATAVTPTPTPTPVSDLLIPTQSASPAAGIGPEDIPALNQLDAAFRRSSLGKEADEARLHLAARELKNRVGSTTEVVAARAAADRASTDLEKRELLRNYYELLYGRMRSLAAGDDLKKYIDNEKALHITGTNQPHVRPAPGVSATPFPKHHKKKEKSR